MWRPGYNWGSETANRICCGCLCWLNESDDHHGLSSLRRHSEGGNRKCTQNSVTLGPCQQLWLGGSQDNKLGSSELCCLFSISRGQSLPCFSFLQWDTSLKCSGLLRNSAQGSAARQNPSWPQDHALSGFGSRKGHLEGPLPSFSPSNFSLSSFCRLSLTYPVERRREVGYGMPGGAFPVPAASEGACCVCRRNHHLLLCCALLWDYSCLQRAALS